MGLKRIMFTAEVTYAADDSRELNTLIGTTTRAVADGLMAQNGTLARIGIAGAAIDPDPEGSADDVPVIVPPDSPES